MVSFSLDTTGTRWRATSVHRRLHRGFDICTVIQSGQRNCTAQQGRFTGYGMLSIEVCCNVLKHWQLHLCGMLFGTMSGPSGTTSRMSIPSKDVQYPRLMKSGHMFSTEVGPPISLALATSDHLWDSEPNSSNGLTFEAHEVRVSEEQMTQSNLSSIRLADGSDDFIVQPIVSLI